MGKNTFAGEGYSGLSEYRPVLHWASIKHGKVR